MNTTCLAGRTVPGELLRLVADGLAGAGLDVRPPADADGCRPWSADDADPDLTADLATVLLTGQAGPQPRLASGHHRENITFKGIVGLELKARGLDVELAVYCDETAVDVFAEIVVTVPGPGDGGGQVCVADDGGLTWTRDYLADAAALSGPGRAGQATDQAGIAGLVMEAVTRAMALLRHAEAGRASHG